MFDNGLACRQRSDQLDARQVALQSKSLLAGNGCAHGKSAPPLMKFSTSFKTNWLFWGRAHVGLAKGAEGRKCVQEFDKSR